jgi:hypothetical protein
MFSTISLRLIYVATVSGTTRKAGLLKAVIEVMENVSCTLLHSPGPSFVKDCSPLVLVDRVDYLMTQSTPKLVMVLTLS